MNFPVCLLPAGCKAFPALTGRKTVPVRSCRPSADRKAFPEHFHRPSADRKGKTFPVPAGYKQNLRAGMRVHRPCRKDCRYIADRMYTLSSVPVFLRFALPMHPPSSLRELLQRPVLFLLPVPEIHFHLFHRPVPLQVFHGFPSLYLLRSREHCYRSHRSAYLPSFHHS